MRSFNSDKLFDIFNNPYENKEYDLFMELGSYNYSFAIPSTADINLKRRLLAALKTYSLGNDSTDYMLKKYSHHWDIKKERDIDTLISDETNKYLTKLMKYIYRFSDAIKVNHKKIPMKLGLVAADLHLQRAVITFQTISHLLRRGLTIESRILLRSILEQICWAYKVSEYEEFNDIEKTQSQKTIQELKQLFPNINIGKLYGDLSEYAHLDSKNRHEYFKIEKNQDYVIYTDKLTAFQLLPTLINIADIYVATYEYIHRDYHTSSESWIKVHNIWTLKKTRFLTKYKAKTTKVILILSLKKIFKGLGKVKSQKKVIQIKIKKSELESHSK